MKQKLENRLMVMVPSLSLRAFKAILARKISGSMS